MCVRVRVCCFCLCLSLYVVFCTTRLCLCNKGNIHHLRATFLCSLFFYTSFFLIRFTFMSTVTLRYTCMKMALFFVAIFSVSLNFFLPFLTFRLWCRTASSIMIWLPLKRNVLFSFSLSIHILMILWCQYEETHTERRIEIESGR